MNFERGKDPKEALGIGLESEILKYFQAHLYTELRSPSTLQKIFQKIEAELNIKLENLCHSNNSYYMIRVRVQESNLIINYEFDAPF